MNEERKESAIVRGLKAMGTIVLITLGLLGFAAVVNMVAPKSKPDTRSVMMSTEEALAVEAGYALPQEKSASPQKDDVGSVEEVEREVQQSSSLKQVIFVDGQPICPACRLPVVPGSTRCPRCTEEFSWCRVSCDLCKGSGELECAKSVRQELWTRGLHWDGMARLEPLCEGVGTHACYRCGGDGRFVDGSTCKILTVTCVYCRGSGKLSCPQCGGDGKLGN